MNNSIEQQPQRICGIDLGLATMGYGILDISVDNKVNYVKHGRIETSKDNLIHHRLSEIYAKLMDVLVNNKVKIVAIEKVFHSVNSKTVNMINQVHGIVYLLLYRLKIPYYEYTPPQVKLAFLGSGKVSKKEIIERVKEQFEIPYETKIKDDEADAVAIAYTFLKKNFNV